MIYVPRVHIISHAFSRWPAHPFHRALLCNYARHRQQFRPPFFCNLYIFTTKKKKNENTCAPSQLIHDDAAAILYSEQKKTRIYIDKQNSFGDFSFIQTLLRPSRLQSAVNFYEAAIYEFFTILINIACYKVGVLSLAGNCCVSLRIVTLSMQTISRFLILSSYSDAFLFQRTAQQIIII